MAQIPSASDIGSVLRELDELKKKLNDAPAPRHVPSTVAAPAEPRPSSVPTFRKLPPIARTTEEPVRGQPSATKAPSVHSQEIESRWQEFLDALKRRHVSLIDAIDGSVPAGVDGNIIKVKCADQFHINTLNRAKEKISDVLLEVFGVRLRLEPEIDSDSRDSVAPEQQVAREEHPTMSLLRKEIGATPL